jgi:hypothetical protein
MTNSIQLYGKTYVKLPPKDDLKQLPQGANGFFKKEQGGIAFHHPDRSPRAFIRKDGLGPVSLAHNDGKRYYMHSHTTPDGDWLGVPDSYTALVEGAKDLAKEIFG